VIADGRGGRKEGVTSKTTAKSAGLPYYSLSVRKCEGFLLKVKVLYASTHARVGSGGRVEEGEGKGRESEQRVSNDL
jgi:hypothetical protein